MLGKFSPEINLVNKLRGRLADKGWSVIQLVCSGGQTHFSITYKIAGKNKTVFPDLVAFKDRQILIGEIKERFDQNDHDKLVELSNSELAISRITRNISIRTKIQIDQLSIKFILINQDFASKDYSLIEQLVFHEETYKLKGLDLEFKTDWW